MKTVNFTDKEKRRYQRQIMLPEIGEAGQEKLKQASALVVGAGGLGCPVLQYLAAAGVGTIGIVDNDQVKESNLQRQILYGRTDLGKLKAIIASQRLTELNDIPAYNVLNTYLRPQNALNIMKDYDIIVDATDNFPSRYLISDACVILGKPLVYGAIYKFEGQVSVFNYKGGPTLRCLYPATDEGKSVPDSESIGVIGVLPGIIGSLQANEVLKIILQEGEVLSGKLFIMDIFNNRNYTVKIKTNPENLKIKEIN
jgi:adenylyltransferase/sulfurtransferase